MTVAEIKHPPQGLYETGLDSALRAFGLDPMKIKVIVPHAAFNKLLQFAHANAFDNSRFVSPGQLIIGHTRFVRESP